MSLHINLRRGLIYFLLFVLNVDIVPKLLIQISNLKLFVYQFMLIVYIPHDEDATPLESHGNQLDELTKTGNFWSHVIIS